MSLAQAQVCVFDAYGTLFDLGAMAETFRPELGDAIDRLMVAWRRKQLEISWLPLRPGATADFWAVTAEALDFAMAKLGLSDPGLRLRLMEGWLTPQPFPDAAPGLAALRDKGLRTAILSNGTRRMIGGAVEAAGLTDVLNAVLSVEEVGRFKPDPLVYGRAMEHFAVPPEAVCFVSGNPWDVHGAAAVGFQVVWINRAGDAAEKTPTGKFATITTLTQLPAVLGGQ